jgi:HD superfamily phosphohydrolase
LKNGELRELSRESDIVDAISGKRRTDHKLYYPADFVAGSEEIMKLLQL